MLAPSPRSNDVQYRIIAPYGLTVFDCNSLRATLQPHHCAANWTACRDGSKCNGCPTGAIHAGKSPAAVQPDKINGRSKPCCRCGQLPTYRLIAGVYCPGCANRSRELVRGFNAKGKHPWQTGEMAREVSAIIRTNNPDAALARIYGRKIPDFGVGFYSGLRQEHKPGIPLISKLDDSHLWGELIVTSPEELTRIVARLFPDSEIVEAEFSASFAERWRAAAEPSSYTAQANP